jgi:CheY-like chemotaxis protein
MTQAPARSWILVAEDDGDDRRLLADAFREAGVDCRLDFHGDGESLLLALQTARPQALPRLILLDLNMPRMDGRETLHRLRADPAMNEIPVVVLSTSASEEEVSRSRRLGCDDYYVKPCDFGAMLDLVGEIAARWLPQPRKTH